MRENAMKRLTIIILLLILVAGCSHVAPPGEVMKKGCGPYPEHYEAMLMDYLSNYLSRPDTLGDVTIIKAPSKITLDADYPFIPLFKGHAAWECFISYDAKNRNGNYTGNSFHVAWIRHNRIVAYDYKDIDLWFAIKNRIHEKYPRENKSDEKS